MSTIRKFYDLDIDQTSTPSPEAKGLPQKEELLNLLRVGKDTAINIPDPFAGVSIPNHISDIPPEAKGTLTAMQMLIKQLKETRKQCIPEFIDGIDYAILEASSFLEVERSNIIDARLSVTGLNHASPTDDKNFQEAELYYNTKYNQ